MIDLPMVIVSYPEVEKRGKGLTILDGIIGQVLARQGFLTKYLNLMNLDKLFMKK
jgi:hypothetical protein